MENVEKRQKQIKISRKKVYYQVKEEEEKMILQKYRQKQVRRKRVQTNNLKIKNNFK